jgi:hypothetical protein
VRVLSKYLTAGPEQTSDSADSIPIDYDGGDTMAIRRGGSGASFPTNSSTPMAAFCSTNSETPFSTNQREPMEGGVSHPRACGRHTLDRGPLSLVLFGMFQRDILCWRIQ